MIRFESILFRNIRLYGGTCPFRIKFKNQTILHYSILIRKLVLFAIRNETTLRVKYQFFKPVLFFIDSHV